jgi:hypothetical protein
MFQTLLGFELCEKKLKYLQVSQFHLRVEGFWKLHSFLQELGLSQLQVDLL